MQIKLETDLACSAARAWQEVNTTRLLRHVARPLLTFEPIDPPQWPAQWQDERYLVRLRLMGLLPLGKQWVVITRWVSQQPRYEVRDNGYGALARRWDHHVSIWPLSESSARYVDRVEIEAGLLTPVVWLFAALFYRHRQRRWRALARSGFQYGE